MFDNVKKRNDIKLSGFCEKIVQTCHLYGKMILFDRIPYRMGGNINPVSVVSAIPKNFQVISIAAAHVQQFSFPAEVFQDICTLLCSLEKFIFHRLVCLQRLPTVIHIRVMFQDFLYWWLGINKDDSTGETPQLLISINAPYERYFC